MELSDLEPKKDPKGGDPIPPTGGYSYTDDDTKRVPTPYPPYRLADLEKKDGFFHVQFRDLLYMISLICVGLLFVFQKQSDVDKLSNNLSSTSKIVEQLSGTVSTQQKLIDSNSSDIRMQTERNLEQDKRIAESQQQLILLVPGMVKIETKLNFVVELLDQQRKSGR